MSADLPILSIPGLMSRPVATCEVARLDSPEGNVEVTFHGPEGPVMLTGTLGDVYRLVVALELSLRDFVVE